MTTSKPKILVILTSADKVPKTGKQIGWYLPELAHPFHVLNPRAELIYATPNGGEPPLDPVSVELFKDDLICKDCLENHESVWKNTLKLSDVAGRASEFDAIFYPAGHGPMVDLIHDEHSKTLLRDFHFQDKIISAVCHGPAAFVNATTASVELILKVHCKSLWSEPINGTRQDSPLVDIVLALCMQFGVTSLPRHSGYKAEINSRDAAVASRWFYQRSQRLIASYLERPTLQTFQCHLWSAIYLVNALCHNMAQNMLGVAARMAYTLGLHIETGKHVPVKEREARKRTGCILFMFKTR